MGSTGSSGVAYTPVLNISSENLPNLGEYRVFETVSRRAPWWGYWCFSLLTLIILTGIGSGLYFLVDYAVGGTSAPTITSSPTTFSPTTLSPTTKSPTPTSPVTSSPTTLTPTNLPTTKSPTTLSPTTSTPTNLPTTASPTTQSPTTLSPTTATPTTASPTTKSPTTAAPTGTYSTIAIFAAGGYFGSNLGATRTTSGGGGTSTNQKCTNAATSLSVGCSTAAISMMCYDDSFTPTLGSIKTIPDILGFSRTTVPVQSYTGTAIAANWATMLDGSTSLTNSFQNAGVIPAGTRMWTGANSDGSTSANNCGTWSSATTAVVGTTTSAFNPAWITGGGAVSCSLALTVVCVCAKI